MSTSTEHFQKISGIIVPVLILICALLFNLTVIPVTASFKVIIPFVLMVGYYWSIYRPEAVPLWAIFICGVLIDVLSGLPLGLNALSLMAVCWIVRDQRVVLITQPFLMLWLLFILFCVAESVMKWLLFGLVSFHWGDLMVLFPDVAASIFIYPFIALFLHFISRISFHQKGGVRG